MGDHLLSRGARRAVTVLATVVWLLLAAGAGAEEQPPQHELLLFEEPTVSAAAKHLQSARAAPSDVTVVTREEIRRFGYRTLADALRSVRGFYGSYDRNYDYVGVRGFLRPGDHNDRILILVNGHTYNDDISQTGTLGNDFGIDLEAVDHIEVIRGPGSALYGGNALFAVVNVVTATAESLGGVHALAETGSFRRKRGQLSVGQTFANGASVLATGSVLDVDGNESLFFPEYNSPRTRNGIARDADAERALNFFMISRYRDFTLQGGINDREKHIPTGAFGTTFGDPGSKTVDGRRFVDLTWDHEVLPHVTLTARAFYDGLRYHGTYVYGAGPGRTKNEDLASSDWLGGEVRALWEITHENSLTVGSEYTYHPSARQRNFDLPSQHVFLDDTRRFGTVGVYAQDEWALRPDLTLVGGLRFDQYYNRLQQVSPRAAAIWTPRDDTTVKLLYGQAFRPPNLYEQYYAYTGAGVQAMPNARLDPERITSYEALVEQRLWLGARGVLAVYRNDISSLIGETSVQRAGITRTQFRNVSSVQAEGAEIELRVPLPHAASLRGAYTIQEARSPGGQLLSNSPKHLGVVGTLFPLPLGTEGGVELRVIGPRRTLAGRQVGPAPVVNLSLSHPTPIRNLVFAAAVYNLLDQAYADPAGPEHVQDRIPQDGITFRLQVRYAF